MATYDKYTLHLGPYQEGNKADIDLDMDDSFPMAAVSVTLVVADRQRKQLISKSSHDGTIVITGQNIHIDLLPADTLGKPGIHAYEIDFINSSLQPFATIGGNFTINAQTNKLIE